MVWREASFGYGAKTVVDQLSLQVNRGEIVALLGANGSGKSTLVKGLVGLSDQQGGQVEVFGHPLEQLRHRRMRRSGGPHLPRGNGPLIGYVPQRHTVAAHDRATVHEVVSVGRLPHLGWHARLGAADRTIVAEALDFVALGASAASTMSDLSGGQQRRVLIARALASQPDLFIMDEPTAGVDETNQRLLADVMGELARLGRTLLVVTHELRAIEHVVTRAVVMASGRIVFDGPPAELSATMAPGEHHHHLGRDEPTTTVRGPFDQVGPHHA